MGIMKHGVPMLMMVSGGAYALAKLLDAKYINESRSRSEILAHTEFDLDYELEKMKRDLDVDNWVQKRIPRPEATDGIDSDAANAFSTENLRKIGENK